MNFFLIFLSSIFSPIPLENATSSRDLISGSRLYDSLLDSAVKPQNDAEQLEQADQLLEKISNTNDEAQRREHLNSVIRIYENCLESNLINGGIFYNLGNCYFLNDQTEKAILAYRQGLKHLPNDSRILNNLNVARKKVPTIFEKSPGSSLLKKLLFFHYWQKDFQSLIFYFSLSCLLISWLISLKFKNSGIKFTIFTSSFVCLLFGISLLNYQEKISGVILLPETYAYQGNGQNFETVFDKALPPGTEFDVIEQRGFWLKVKFANDSTGWLNQNNLGLTTFSTADRN